MSKLRTAKLYMRVKFIASAELPLVYETDEQKGKPVKEKAVRYTTHTMGADRSYFTAIISLIHTILICSHAEKGGSRELSHPANISAFISMSPEPNKLSGICARSLAD